MSKSQNISLISLLDEEIVQEVPSIEFFGETDAELNQLRLRYSAVSLIEIFQDFQELFFRVFELNIFQGFLKSLIGVKVTR